MSQSPHESSRAERVLEILVDQFPASVAPPRLAELATGRRNGNCTHDLRALRDGGLARQDPGTRGWKATAEGVRRVAAARRRPRPARVFGHPVCLVIRAVAAARRDLTADQIREGLRSLAEAGAATATIDPVALPSMPTVRTQVSHGRNGWPMAPLTPHQISLLVG